MSEEIEKRLKESSETCLSAYKDWCGDEKDHNKREALSDAMHELRKVCARLEIEMAASERDEQKSAPLPIPPHKASRGATPQENGGGDKDGKPEKSSKGGGTRRQGGGGGRRRSSG